MGQGSELTQRGWSRWRLQWPGLDRRGQEEVQMEGQAEGQGRRLGLQQRHGQGLRPGRQFGATTRKQRSSVGGQRGTRFASSIATRV